MGWKNRTAMTIMPMTGWPFFAFNCRRRVSFLDFFGGNLSRRDGVMLYQIEISGNPHSQSESSDGNHVRHYLPARVEPHEALEFEQVHYGGAKREHEPECQAHESAMDRYGILSGLCGLNAGKACCCDGCELNLAVGKKGGLRACNHLPSSSHVKLEDSLCCILKLDIRARGMW